MSGKLATKVALLISTLVFLFSITACRTNGGSVGIGWGNQYSQKPTTAPPTKYEDKKNGPPAHAPAHGYRAKHQYRYYPDESVYFDTGANNYFYIDNGTWRVSASLPHAISLSSEYVSLALDTDKPYQYYSEHKEQYPSGKSKKNNKNKNKNKGNGKGNKKNY